MERTKIEANTEYQKLLARANADGVVVKARVADHTTGALLGFLVSGKHGDTYHVTANGNHLSCDCYVGKTGALCKHRCACTHHEIERAGATQAPAVAPILSERVTGADWLSERAAAMPVRGNQGAHLYL